MVAIIQDSQTPYYRQLYEILRDDLISGKWHPGERMPSESELIEQYGVSRITVRQSLDMLVKEGRVYRRRGRGTFAAIPTIEQGLTRIISFTEDMEQRGLHPGTRILSSRLEPATEAIAKRLDLAPGSELAVLERLRLADDEPMSLEISHLDHTLCPGILDGDYAQTPLHEALRDQADIRLVRANQSIHAIAANRELAGILSVAVRAPLFYIERVSYSQYGAPVEYLQIYHRGDRYVLYNELLN
jgi:GntR family transcriptional regulator